MPAQIEAPSLRQIAGEVLRIQATRDRWFSGIIYDGQKNLKVSGTVGVIPPVGSTLVFEGEEYNDPKFGPQVKIRKLISVEAPQGRQGAIAFLETLDAISKVRARNIVAALGDDAISIICNDPNVLSQIPGFGERLIKIVGKQLIERKATMECEIALLSMKLSAAVRIKVVECFGNRLRTIIKEDPYELTVVDGVSFAKIDAWVMASGLLAADSAERGAAIIVESLKIQAAYGHTYQDLGTILDGAKKLNLVMPFPEENLEQSLRLAVKKQMVVECREGFGLARLIRAEQMIFSIMSSWLSNPFELGDANLIPEEIGSILTDEQRGAVLTAISERVSILTGGPGTGKTLTSKAILGAFPRTTVAVVAPTGKAAKRASEVTGLPAMTIHRFIGKINSRLNDPDEYPDPNAIIPQVTLVDEASMVDVELFFELLSLLNMRDQARIVIVGDVDQLPSVGPGQILYDLISCNKVPVTVLTKVMRQKGTDNQIVDNAYLINNGKMPENDVRSHRQWLFGEQADIAKVQEWIKTFLTVRCQSMGFDPIKHVQVLTGQRQHALGCEGLNNVIRECLNPPARSKAEITKIEDGKRIVLFREGDKVMHTENNANLGVVNGDQGIIQKINLVPEKDHETTVEILLDSGETVTLRKNDLGSLVQAWAITVHKSQGSEYPVVVMICHDSLAWSLQRALLYTGVTRAKKHLVLFGTSSAIQTAVLKERDPRMTRLASLFVAKKKQSKKK